MNLIAVLDIFLYERAWPFWLGGLGLAGVAIGFCALARRPLGVSGFVRRVLFWREQKQGQLERQQLADKQELVQKAMREAAEAQLALLPEEQRVEVEAAMKAAEAQATEHNSKNRPNHWSVESSLVYLIGILLGGALSQCLHTDFTLEKAPSGLFQEYFNSAILGYVVLLVGGLFVGFGTAMAGGCTSGHGLSGNARFQTGSIVATACFFGTAILSAITMKWLLL